MKRSKIEQPELLTPLFKQEEDYYKPVRVSSFWNIKYIENESNGDKI